MGRIEAGALIVVSDAGPLIHLDELGCLDVLDYPQVVVPETVWQEVLRHRPRALEHPEVNLKRHQVDALTPRVAAVSPLFGLHRREQDALAVCMGFENCLFLTDDAAARMAAESLHVLARGTIGSILRTVRRRLRTPSEALALLRRIPESSTLHIRPALLARIVRQVEEEWGKQ